MRSNQGFIHSFRKYVPSVCCVTGFPESAAKRHASPGSSRDSFTGRAGRQRSGAGAHGARRGGRRGAADRTFGRRGPPPSFPFSVGPGYLTRNEFSAPMCSSGVRLSPSLPASPVTWPSMPGAGPLARLCRKVRWAEADVFLVGLWPCPVTCGAT